MDLIHNHRRRPIDVRLEPLVGDVLDACAEGGLHVLERVALDGITIEDGELVEIRALSTRGEAELSVESRAVELVAREGIESSAEYARSIQDALLRAAGGFRSGQIEATSALLAECIDALSVLLYVIGRIARTLGTEASELEGWAGSLTAPFSELVECRERGDWIGLSDLLEYEVAARLGAWSERLEHLCVRTARGSDVAEGRSEA